MTWARRVANSDRPAGGRLPGIKNKTELDYNIIMNSTKKVYRPRVIVRGNTGTRVMKSRKDKAISRQAMKLALRKEW